MLIPLLTACDANLKARKTAQKAFAAYGNDDKLKAAQYFLRLSEKFPESHFYGRNLYNASYIFYEIDSLNKAKLLFLRVLDSDIHDDEKDSSRQWGMTRTNYKHFACRNLGTIAHRQSDLRTAIQYFQRAQSEFRFVSDSSEMVKRQEVLLRQQISNVYLDMNKPDSALIVVLPDALSESPWSKHHAKEFTKQIIYTHFDPKAVLSELIAGFGNINQHPSFVVIPFYNYEIVVAPYLTNIEKMTGSYFKRTAFYVDLYRHVHYPKKQ